MIDTIKLVMQDLKETLDTLESYSEDKKLKKSFEDVIRYYKEIYKIKE